MNQDKHVMSDEPQVDDLMDDILDLLDGHSLCHALGALATTFGRLLLSESGDSFLTLQVKANGEEIVTSRMSKEGPIQ